MPTYTFKCNQCKKIFEDLVKIGEQNAVSECCNSIGDRVWTSSSAPNFHTRGSWVDHSRVDDGIPQGEMMGDSVFKGDINDPKYVGKAP